MLRSSLQINIEELMKQEYLYKAISFQVSILSLWGIGVQSMPQGHKGFKHNSCFFSIGG